MAKKRKRAKRTHIGIVRVGPITLDVYETPHAVNEQGQKFFGYVDHSNSYVLLDAKMKPSRRRSTLFHEVLHAVSYEYGIGLTEKQVGKLETSLLAVLDDNPDLLGGG